MRIMQVIQTLGVGGAERVVLALDAAVREAGHASRVVASSGELSRQLPGSHCEIPLVSRHPWRFPLVAGIIRREISRWGPDVVHAHNPTMGLAVALATAKGRKAPALTTMHGIPDQEYSAVGRLLRLSGLPIVACGAGVAVALEATGCGVIGIIENGVSSIGSVPPRSEVRLGAGLPIKTPVLLVVGRLAPQKNIGLAIRAVSLLSPPVTLAVAGEGPLRHELEDLAVELGVADRVIFLGQRPDVRTVMTASDLVMITSHWEGLPLVALEAAASQAPIVATNVRGISELLTHDVDSILVPTDDAHALATASTALLADQSLRNRLLEGGARLAAAHNETQMTDRYLSLYSSLAEPGTRAGARRGGPRGKASRVTSDAVSAWTSHE